MSATKERLTQLEVTGLLRLAQTHPELEFIFRHALVQDVAYESLLLADRRHLHQQVGETLERLYPDQLEELAPVLGQHFLLAESNKHALKYFILAADVAAAEYANVEAIEHYHQALKLINKDEANNEQLTYLYTQLGRMLELNSQNELALEIYEEMEKVAHRQQNSAMELVALTARSKLYVTFTSVHNPDRGEELSQKAITLARQLDDKMAESKILWNLAILYLYTDRSAAQAIDYCERSLALARELNLREQIAYTLNDLGTAYQGSCHISKSQNALSEANAMWREFENLPMLADNLSSSSLAWLIAGEYQQAIDFSQEARQISESIDNLWGQSYSYNWVGWAYWKLGQPQQAITAMEECIRLGELAGYLPPKAIVTSSLAATLGSLGHAKDGFSLIHQAVKIAKEHLKLFLGYTLAELAKLHLSDNNIIEAKNVIEQAKNDSSLEGAPLFFIYVLLVDIEVTLMQGDYKQTINLANNFLTKLRQFGLQAHIPDALYFQGQAFLALGQKVAAYDCLQEARNVAEATDARWILWQILTVLAQLEDDTTQAEYLHQQAHNIIYYVADHTPLKLRDSFLNLPQVQQVLTKTQNG